MEKFTTTAEILRQVFGKLYTVMPQINDGTTLFAAWTKILGGAGRTDYSVVNSISDILVITDRLEDQIRSSSQLDKFLIDSALATIAGFKPLFQFQSMNSHFYNFKQNLLPSNIGQMGIIGLSIKDEFSEPKLSAEDGKIILELLNSVKILLRDNDLPSSLRVDLIRHIDTIIWWLSKPEMTNLQHILEKTGSTLVVARQIEEKMSKLSHPEKGKAISDQIGSVFSVVSKAMNFLVGNAENFQKLGSAYAGLTADNSATKL